MRGRSARARRWGRWTSRWRSSSKSSLPPSLMIGHYPGRNLNKENYLAHIACICLTGIISSSLDSCAQPPSTRLIQHNHNPPQTFWAGRCLVNAVKIPQSKERATSVFCHQPPWSRQVWNMLQNFRKYSTNIPIWPGFKFWNICSCHKNADKHCDTNATKAFWSRATVAAGIVTVLPHRQHHYQKTTLHDCLATTWFKIICILSC